MQFESRHGYIRLIFSLVLFEGLLFWLFNLLFWFCNPICLQSINVYSTIYNKIVYGHSIYKHYFKLNSVGTRHHQKKGGN